MKSFIKVLLPFVLLSTNIFSQNVTNNPYVERQLKSNIATENITSIYIDEEYTFVTCEYITSRYLSDGWMSLSSKTTLTAQNSNLNLRIISWGTFDEENIYPMDFDVHYNTKSDRRFVFYMLFPSIPQGIENITIRENLGTDNEFFWSGIHINNSAPLTSSGSSRYGNYPRYNSNNSYSGSSLSEFEPQGSGTCFALSSNGLLVTCYHVIEDANRIQIRGINGNFDKVYRAKIVSYDRNNDLAILKIEDPDFSSLGTIPYSLFEKTIEVGEDIFVLGYPLRAAMGDEIKLTSGLISSKSGFQGDVTSYQISAAVQPGNSGGPLFDKKGNLIGVVNAKLTIAESASYAVKTPYLKTLISSIDDNIPTTTNSLYGKSLSEQVKAIKKFVYIIEIQ